MSLTTFAFRNYRFVIVVAAAATVLGVLGFLRMPRQEDPTLSAFTGVVTVVYPGASVDEVEDRVVEPIEEALFALEDVETVESTARADVATITAEFREDADKQRAYDLVVQRVASVRPELPPGVTEVRTWDAKPSNVVVFQIGVHGDDADPGELEIWAEELEARLRVLPQTKEVKLAGESRRQVHVTVDPVRTAAAHLTLSQVYQAIAAANDRLPGGIVQAGPRRMSIRPVSRLRDLDDVRETVVATVNGRPVRVAELAEVTWGEEDPHYLSRVNGQPAAFVTVTMKEGENVFQLARGARHALEEFRESLPPGIEATVVVDQSADVERRLRIFGGSLLQGGLFISFFVALLTGWRPALAVVSALLLSVGISFWLLDSFGIALQQMSIAGLVVVLGLLVDNAIVVVESILQHRAKGEEGPRAAHNGTNRVASAVASSTATTVAAFAPMLLMAGSVGEFTRDIPIVVVLVLTVSLGVALLVTPLMSSRLFRRKIEGRSLAPWIRRTLVENLYARLLQFVVQRPARAVLLALALGALPFLATPFIGMNFFPVSDKPFFLVRVETPQGTSLETTMDRAEAVESWLRKQPGVRTVAASLGEGNPTIYYNQLRLASASNLAEIVVALENTSEEGTPELARRLRATFAKQPDFKVETKLFMQGPPIGLPVSVRLYGNDLERLGRHADTLAHELRNIPGAINVHNGLAAGAPRLDLEVDPVKVGKLGLDPAFVSREVRLALAGGAATQLRVGNEDYDVVVRVAEEGAEHLADLERVYLPLAGYELVPLSQLTEPRLASTYAEIAHTDLERSVIVGSDLDGRLATEVMGDLLPCAEALDLRPGERFEVIGEDEERDRAFLSMLQNVIVAVGLIYGVLVLQFRSFIHPLLIFTSIPVAFGGSVTGLLVGGWDFGFTAFVGLLALTGIVVNNAIVLVDAINRLRREGYTLIEAMRTGAASRFQPILLTTLTTVSGLLPLTLTGGSMWGPMGWVIIGGLLSSTGVTLLLVPALYYMVESRREQAASTDHTPRDTASRSVRWSPSPISTVWIVGLLLSPLASTAVASGSTSGSTQLDLQTVLAQVGDRNAGLAAERAVAKQAEAGLRSARASRLPAVQFEAGWQITDDPSQTFGLSLLSGGNPFELGSGSVDAGRASVGARWVLFDKSRGGRIDAASSQHQMAEFGVDAARQQLELAAVAAYFAVAAAEEEVRAREVALEFVQREREDAEARLAVGRTLEADVLGLRAREAELQSAFILAEGARSRAKARLAELIGQDDGAALSVDATETIAPLPEEYTADLSAARRLAKEARPELKMRSALVSASAAAQSAANGQRFPLLVGEASYTGVVPEGDFDAESRFYAATLGLEWTLFRGGGISADQERARAGHQEALERLEAASLIVDRDVTEAWSHWESARSNATATQVGREAAEEAARIVSLRYREGRDRLTRFLDAESARTDAQTAEIRARAALQTASAQLRWSCGLPLVEGDKTFPDSRR